MAALWETAVRQREHKACSTQNIGMQVRACSSARDSDPSEHPVLTSDVLLQLRLVQHHLQTLPDTTQKQRTKSGGVAYISREFS
jgi:hypothetical protein